ncbi:MAG: hypothetical protein RLY86_1036 [Pseudomonadota bacterium]|jgi:hypothetical protein
MSDRQQDSDRRQDVAMAIKRCLDSLAVDARQGRMPELAHFIALASLAAEDAAKSCTQAHSPAQAADRGGMDRHAGDRHGSDRHGSDRQGVDLLHQEPAGRC